MIIVVGGTLAAFGAATAGAHSYSGLASPIPTDCPDTYTCVYLSLSYVNFGSKFAGTNSAWKTNGVAWSAYNEDDSTYNNGATSSVVIYEGEGHTGDWYCLPRDRGLTDIAFHHDRDGESNKWVSSCP